MLAIVGRPADSGAESVEVMVPAIPRLERERVAVSK
jgi:hypothetical protein